MRVVLVTPTPPVLTKPRPHHFVRGLAEQGHEVHVVFQAPSSEHVSALERAPGWGELRAAAASATWVPLPLRRSLAQSALALFTPTPLRVAYCRTPALAQAVEGVARAVDADLLHVDRERLAPHFGGLAIPKVLDATDSLTLFLRRTLRRGPVGERLIALAELPKMPRYERGMGAGYGRVLVTSDVDAEALREVGVREELRVVPNGVEQRLLEAERDPEPGTLVFVGNLSYAPNVDGARWLMRSVLPRVRRAHPSARLILVGHDPSRSVGRLAAASGVEVTGTVADVLPYLRRAACFVAPIRVGGGFSNKVAEALAAAAPTVSTPAALEGLPDVVDGEHARVAGDAESFASAVVELLGDPPAAERLGEAGRSLARRRYAWPEVIRRLEAIYGEVVSEPTGDAPGGG